MLVVVEILYPALLKESCSVYGLTWECGEKEEFSSKSVNFFCKESISNILGFGSHSWSMLDILHLFVSQTFNIVKNIGVQNPKQDTGYIWLGLGRVWPLSSYCQTWGQCLVPFDMALDGTLLKATLSSYCTLGQKSFPFLYLQSTYVSSHAVQYSLYYITCND